MGLPGSTSFQSSRSLRTATVLLRKKIIRKGISILAVLADRDVEHGGAVQDLHRISILAVLADRDMRTTKALRHPVKISILAVLADRD